MSGKVLNYWKLLARCNYRFVRGGCQTSMFRLGSFVVTNVSVVAGDADMES